MVDGRDDDMRCKLRMTDMGPWPDGGGLRQRWRMLFSRMVSILKSVYYGRVIFGCRHAERGLGIGVRCTRKGNDGRGALLFPQAQSQGAGGRRWQPARGCEAAYRSGPGLVATGQAQCYA